MSHLGKPIIYLHHSDTVAGVSEGEESDDVTSEKDETENTNDSGFKDTASDCDE